VRLLWGAALTLLLTGAAAAETLRIATFNASLTRGAPGALLGDIQGGEDTQVEAVAQIIRKVRPDILLINEFDYDGTNAALTAFATALAKPGAGTDGHSMTHAFSAPSNTGWPAKMDLDGDGEVGGPGDAWGYGRFPGQYGMALLSRFPIQAEGSATFQTMRWLEMPDALLPEYIDGQPFPSASAQAAMRLSSKSHWDLAVDVEGTVLRILASHPTPPVFDGPEDRNGRRNHDEIRFWSLYLDGQGFRDDDGNIRRLGPEPVVVMGDLNADPVDGDGMRAAVTALVTHRRLQDPRPASDGGRAAADAQGGANAGHRGDPALDTADWRDQNGPGNLRVDYVLPDRRLKLLDAGVFWPLPEAPEFAWIGEGRPVSSDHRLVWIDVELP